MFLEIHAVKAQAPRLKDRKRSQAFDPIPPVADMIIAKASLLCFDEFQVRLRFVFHRLCNRTCGFWIDVLLTQVAFYI